MKFVLLLAFFVIASSFLSIPVSFGDHATAVIDIMSPTARQNFEVAADLGSEIIWTNHTSESINITSGSPRNGPDGLFEVLLLNPGESFSYKYDEDSIEREPFTNKEWYSETHRNISGVVIIQIGEHSHADGGHGDDMKASTAITSDDIEEIEKIPEWVKNIFTWFSLDQISEDEVLNSIKFLVNQGIIDLDK